MSPGKRCGRRLQHLWGAPAPLPAGSAAAGEPARPRASFLCYRMYRGPRGPSQGHDVLPAPGPVFPGRAPAGLAAGRPALPLNAAFVRSPLASFHTSGPPFRPLHVPSDPAVTVPSHDHPLASLTASLLPQWLFRSPRARPGLLAAAEELPSCWQDNPASPKPQAASGTCQSSSSQMHPQEGQGCFAPSPAHGLVLLHAQPVVNGSIPNSPACGVQGTVPADISPCRGTSSPHTHWKMGI